jgi:hypothetical protein
MKREATPFISYPKWLVLLGTMGMHIAQCHAYSEYTERVEPKGKRQGKPSTYTYANLKRK